MKARSYRESNRSGIEALLNASWPDDPLMRELQGLHGPAEDEPWRRTLVVEANCEVVAAGTVRLGQRHPARYWLALNVAPTWRRQGIGSRLLADLRDLTALDPRPFRVQARPSDAATMGFLHHYGFRPRVRTWEGVIDPQNEIVLRRLAELTVNVDGFRVTRPRGEALQAEVARLAAFYEDWYAAIHTWDPPAHWPIERCLEHFCGQDLIADSVTCVWRDDELTGAGSLIVPPFDPNPNELYLVQVGVLGVDPPVAESLTASLVADLLRYAARVQKTVRFEVDDAHAVLWKALETLPLMSSSLDFAIFVDDLSPRSWIPGRHLARQFVP